MSDSLYDRNQVTKVKNGDPIADCFGIIARRDSAVLAVADGVNWGKFKKTIKGKRYWPAERAPYKIQMVTFNSKYNDFLKALEL